ncbi:Predicted protein [Anoxybacillus flavithermus WK1]|uniref:Uncharacterized protein n=1 Tax=Anoxybacillus flavithermus (strain DSM 21510 / WK1) TaxID=491915 RepID=B7GLC1_ANOFW|nr:Predicted protein [Anoxybacillus flavithermus WK1]
MTRKISYAIDAIIIQKTVRGVNKKIF